MQKLKDSKLKDSELRYRRLFETAQDGILILNAGTGMIEDVNPYLINMLGYSREEFIKKKLWEVGAFKDIKASKDAFEVLQDQEYIRYENLLLKTKDGRMIAVEFVSNVYLAGDEKVIQCNIRDITEHKQVIVALQANERKYFNLLNQSSDGIFIIDLSGNILTVNKAMCRELGFSEEEFLSMNIWDIIPQHYLDQYKERLTKILRGESFEEASVYEVRGKDGSNHYVEVFSTPHYNDKNIIGFQGIARDITARLRAEKELVESEEKYRMIVETMAEGMWVVDKDWRTTYVNPAMAEMLGYTVAEILGRVPLEFVDREEAPKTSGMMKRREKGITEKTEVRMRRKDGAMFWAYGTSVSIMNDKGEFVGGLSLVADITERKRAEAKLYESEERFKNAFQYSAIGMALVSLAGKWLKVNSLFCSIVGYSEAELLTKSFQDITHPDDLDADLGKLKQLLAGEISTYKMEKRYFHKTGKLIWVLLAVALARDNAGVPLYLIAQMEDITERKQMENEVKKQLDELQSWHNITLGREMRILDLKREVNELLGKAGQTPRYASAEFKNQAER